MDNKQFISSIAEFATTKNIDRLTIIHMLQDVLYGLIEKKFGTRNNFDIVIDPKKGDLQIWRTRTIVADDAEEAKQYNKITLSEAKKIEEDFEVGEEVVEEISISMFKRRAVVEGMQLFMRKRDLLEKKRIFTQYMKLIGTVITAEVGYSTPKHVVLYDNDRNELLLPKTGQIPEERYRKGAYVRAIIEKVIDLPHKINIIVSRTSGEFVKQLLTLEIPEIIDNIVVIKGVGRIPGLRSKVIVASKDDRIDGAGACIGPGGRRVQTISKEHLNSERIEVISYTDDLPLLIKRITGLEQLPSFEQQDNGLIFYAAPAQMAVLHRAIPFLKQLLQCTVKIIQQTVKKKTRTPSLNDPTDVIEKPVLKALQDIGLTSVQSVLDMPKETLVDKTHLPEDAIHNLYRILGKINKQQELLSNIS